MVVAFSGRHVSGCAVQLSSEQDCGGVCEFSVALTSLLRVLSLRDNDLESLSNDIES